MILEECAASILTMKGTILLLGSSHFLFPFCIGLACVVLPIPHAVELTDHLPFVAWLCNITYPSPNSL
jgi:hypothetical protein